MDLEAEQIAELLRATASLLWVVVAIVALLVFRRVLVERERGPLSKLGVGPTGVTFEFAEQKLKEAVARAADTADDTPIVGLAAQRTVVERLRRSIDLVDGAKVMWVDDHPENNTALVDVLTHYGASVDLARTNHQAFRLLDSTNYDVVVSDVARDREGPGSDLKGIELAERVVDRTGEKILLFTARFNPFTVPGMSEAERFRLASIVQRSVFGTTNRFDEALHLILDVLERNRS